QDPPHLRQDSGGPGGEDQDDRVADRVPTRLDRGTGAADAEVRAHRQARQSERAHRRTVVLTRARTDRRSLPARLRSHRRPAAAPEGSLFLVTNLFFSQEKPTRKRVSTRTSKTRDASAKGRSLDLFRRHLALLFLGQLLTDAPAPFGHTRRMQILGEAGRGDD